MNGVYKINASKSRCFQRSSSKSTFHFSATRDPADEKFEEVFGRTSGPFWYLPDTIRVLVKRTSAASSRPHSVSLLTRELDTARKLEAADDKARAALSYEIIARRYEGSKRAKVASERLRKLMADKSIARAVRKKWGGLEKPTDPFAATLLTAARAARDRGDSKEARRLYEAVVAKHPNSTEEKQAEKKLGELP